ncbi:MAG TPA: asparagine synthase-related protein [Candidatus Binataceae bacterium]|nr:asparagine synthase-related protein [Candidatus Binataceae bacterium]
MSGIAVIYNPDGRPADRGLFDRMMGVIAHRGPDGSGSWIDGAVAIGYQKFCTTPESLRENQPLADPSGRYHLVFDGRVDNRAELTTTLKGRSVLPRDDTDAELVLRTYECFGAETPHRILGDFCMVVWDSARRELFCARDICAVRKLFYYFDGKSFLCGTELVQVLADPRVPRDPNEGAIGEYLSGSLGATEDTLYRHIKRLPSAHSITVGPNGLRMQRYFDLDPRRQVRYRDDREYAEHFGEIFQETIRCRTRVIGPYGIHLSGGLDSTSIVGMAVPMSTAGKVPPFETYSMLFDEPSVDERSYIHETVAMLGLKANYFAPFKLDLPAAIASISRFREFTEYPNGAIWHPVWKTAREKGVRVLLSGTGSDEWMAGSPWFFADLLLAGDWQRLWHRVRTDSRLYGGASGLAPSLKFLLHRAIWPLLPLELRKPIRRLRKTSGLPSFVRAPFAQRHHLWDRVQREPRLPHATFGQVALYNNFVDGWVMHGREITDREIAPYGLEERHPFLDRRLMEFLMAIPDDQRIRDNLPKFVLREAIRGKIPDSICDRRDKAYFSITFVEAFERMGGERLFARMALDEAGIVDRQEFLRVYRHRLADWDNQNLWPLWNTLAAELWYRVAYLNEIAEAAN